MGNTFNSEAMAFIETELDSIVKNFEKSYYENAIEPPRY